MQWGTLVALFCCIWLLLYFVFIPDHLLFWQHSIRIKCKLGKRRSLTWVTHRVPANRFRGGLLCVTEPTDFKNKVKDLGPWPLWRQCLSLGFCFVFRETGITFPFLESPLGCNSFLSQGATVLIAPGSAVGTEFKSCRTGSYLICLLVS